jgi:GTP-binding protein
MMVDSRHGFTPLDRQLLDFVAQRVGIGEVRLLVLLTKADKLSRSEGAKALGAAQKVLAELATDTADISLVLFSALSRQGVADAAVVLREWRDAAVAAQATAAAAEAAATAADTPPGPDADAPPLSPA